MRIFPLVVLVLLAFCSCEEDSGGGGKRRKARKKRSSAVVQNSSGKAMRLNAGGAAIGGGGGGSGVTAQCVFDAAREGEAKSNDHLAPTIYTSDPDIFTLEHCCRRYRRTGTYEFSDGKVYSCRSRSYQN